MDSTELVEPMTSTTPINAAIRVRTRDDGLRHLLGETTSRVVA